MRGAGSEARGRRLRCNGDAHLLHAVSLIVPSHDLHPPTLAVGTGRKTKRTNAVTASRQAIRRDIAPRFEQKTVFPSEDPGRARVFIHKTRSDLARREPCSPPSFVKEVSFFFFLLNSLPSSCELSARVVGGKRRQGVGVSAAERESGVEETMWFGSFVFVQLHLSHGSRRPWSCPGRFARDTLFYQPYFVE